MSEFVVEKGIPLPHPGQKKYPWEKMGLGDSFVVPIEEGDSPGRVRSTVRTAGLAWLERNGRTDQTIAFRREGSAWRVWLVSKKPGEVTP